MGKFVFTKTAIEDVVLIEPAVFGDSRGYFMETYNFNDFQAAGIDAVFVQDNQSKSGKGVLRGLHYQKNHPQGKLVRVIQGEVFDVAVDIRPDSATYGQWVGVHLSKENNRQLYVPPGLAHGFLVVSEEAEFSYKCTDFYHPEDEAGVLWNDPAIGIEWPLEGIEEVQLAAKDRNYPPFVKIK